MLTPAGDMTTQDAAKNLLAYGFLLISLLPKSKKPVGGDGWQERVVHQAGDAQKVYTRSLPKLLSRPVIDCPLIL
jgi:hypothetical protein